MIFFDVTPVQPGRSPILSILHGCAKWLVDANAKRKRTAVLQELLFMPEHRLRDMGIHRDVVLETLERRSGRPVGSVGSLGSLGSDPFT